ncbi:unnamed protein product [Ectocarpus fasciculatus]
MPGGGSSMPGGTSLSTARAAMSPHGIAMDAAMRIVEESGHRLGIIAREEKKEATASSAFSINHRAPDSARSPPISPAMMSSLEHRRERAKAWAKSRCVVGVKTLDTITSQIPKLYVRMYCCRFYSSNQRCLTCTHTGPWLRFLRLTPPP